MQRESSSRIAVLLLDTLRKLECEQEAPRDDPAVASLERYVVRLVGELDAIRGDGDRRFAIPSEPPSPSPKILEILRSTLIQMEQMSENQPDVGSLKDNLIRAIAELEAAGISHSQSAARELLKSGDSNAVPAPSDSVAHCRDGPLPAEVGLQRSSGQTIPAGKKRNRPREAEVTGEGAASRSKSGGGC